MYLTFWNSGSGKLVQYSLSTPFDVGTASKVGDISITQPDWICFSSDWNYFYYGRESDHTIKRYSLSTAWDISTATQDQSYSVWGKYAGSVCLSNDWLHMAYAWNDNEVWKWCTCDLSTPRDLTTVNNLNISINTPYAFINGRWEIYGFFDSNILGQYEASTPFDISSTLTQIGSFDTSGLSGLEWRAWWFSNDGKYRTVWQNNLSINLYEAQPM